MDPERLLDRWSEASDGAPSTVYAKPWVLKKHLVPAFGRTRLDEIGPPDVEAYRTAKTKDGLSRTSINNHLAALSKCCTSRPSGASSPARPR